MLWRRWQVSWLLKRTSRNFPGERILRGSRLGTWLLTSKTCLSVSRSLGRALSYLKGCDEEGRERLPFPSEEYTSHMGRCMGSHWNTKSETFQPEPPDLSNAAVLGSRPIYLMRLSWLLEARAIVLSMHPRDLLLYQEQGKHSTNVSWIICLAYNILIKRT